MAVVSGSIAAGAALAKLGIGAKLMGALKGAGALVGLGGKAGAAAKATQLAIPGLTTAAKAGGTRMAGTGLLSGLKGKLGANFVKAFPGGKKDIIGSVIPDVAFGTLTGIMTPGDLGDKVLAGATDTVIGAGLTGGLRGVTGARGLAGTAIEMGGGAATGLVSQPVIDSVLRAKGGGMSPYDKLQLEQNAAIRREVEQDVLRQLMSGRRSPVIGDPFLTENGLG
jgi:hypothetical protein